MPSININGFKQTFNNIFYVDSTNGSDSNNGTINSPFMTVNHAISRCGTTGGAIYAKAGTYDVTRIAGDYDSGGLWDDNKAISFFGEQGKTVFLCDGAKHKNRDTHCIMFQNEGTKAYHITFDFKVGTRSGNYPTCITGVGGNSVKGEVINCLFKIDSLSPCLAYSNNALSTIKFTNCVFEVKTNFVGSYSGAGFTIENCATNFLFYGEGTRKNIYSNATFNSNYHITNYDESKLNIGLYAGVCSWEYTLKLFGSLLRANNKTYSTESVDIWYETKMTSNFAPSPLVASASSEYNSSYYAWKAFNGTNISGNYDEWISATGQLTGWIQIDYGKKVKANRLILTASPDTTYLASTPKKFNILYSNDGINFSKARTIENQTNWTTKENREFVFRGIEARYLRIEIIEINGSTNYIVIGEIQFGYNGLTLKKIPSSSLENFLKYGRNSFSGLNYIIANVNYILQDKTIDKEDGLRKTKLDKKPFSISFK
ncbi:discoidin domain-containing protein [Lysinibacillus sp. NPDC093692]|uniref:discoidin domain-containing protein n=1 Tax=Lysinibacillus sp. NPDC093692 TaxID=3390578 RepID=UPI003D030F21